MKKTSKFSFGSFLRRSSVPIMFIIICAFCIPLSGLSPSYLINEIVTRMGRNAFLIISLLIPIMAGMGLFFINGVYQLVVLYLMGSIIPIKHTSIKLPRGYGIRNTVSLLSMRQKLDNLIPLTINGVKIPVATFIIIALLCLFIVWFRRTKLGQDMRAVGQDMEVARDAGINVERTRIIAIIISTILAGVGMIIYLQNMGNIATYSSHSQIGMFCIAALLVGGASVDKASIGNVFLGVILFHLMFIVAPKAGAAITGDSMIGEYFRVFVSYAVITIALVMYETSKRKEKKLGSEQLREAQLEEEKK